ncbi:MAG TPA: DNA polymerase/3'-5' exonuclease PolX [Spirochaetia bacterium]|nr:DNA polymerase/3'-5' exonuclease PolX [Spirochaetia bacterium]
MVSSSRDNREIASILEEIALYQELSEENPFKVRAFEQAARNIEALEENLGLAAEGGRLTEIKGIGKGIAEVIHDILDKGFSPLLEELKATFPQGLKELLEIPGMGTKKTRAVWKKLGVSSVGELEYACRENRLLTLEGFGQKSQQKILKGIEFRKQHSGQHLVSEVLGIAEDVLRLLEGTGLFERIDIAGSLRRGKGTFKDIDILLVPHPDTEREAIREGLLALADSSQEADGIIGAGDTKVSIRRGGLQIDFRIVHEQSYPAALQHFTGSREHNTLLRGRAKGMGLKMNEYGVFRAEEALPLRSEEDVYHSIDLPWIPPEIREADGEIEAAQEGKLPRLVEESDFRGMIHVHSNYSDGLSTIEELALECKKRGYSYLCLSDHSRSAFYARGLTVERLKAQWEEVEGLNEKLSPFRIFRGIESDILSDGSLDYPEEVLTQFDFVIGSIHSKLGMDREDATERLIRAVRNPYLTILGHPSGRLLLSREGYPFDEARLYEALAEEGVVLEHNCNPYRLDPGWESLKRAKRMSVPVSINPDAHRIDGFDDMRYGVIMARKAWLGTEDLLNCRGAEEIDEFFRKRKKR